MRNGGLAQHWSQSEIQARYASGRVFSLSAVLLHDQLWLMGSLSRAVG